MTPVATLTNVSVIPCLRYRDARAAIAWLGEIFGFERHLVVPGEAGTIAHAQLSLGNGMVMLGSAVPSEFGRFLKQPDEVGGASTQSIHVVVPDPDAIYARAKASGATIAIDIRDEDFGGRAFSCFDPEGHLWSFGSYDPNRGS